MKFRIFSVAAFGACLWVGNAAMAAELSVIYKPTQAETEQRYIKLLQSENGLPAMVEFVNGFIELNVPLKLLVGAEDGPYYDPEEQIIALPIAFAQEIEDRFVSNDESLQSDMDALNQIVLDVVMHTLFHEFGHALVAQYNIPILAKEEDAVDGLANVLLLDHIEHGADIASVAAEMFGLEDQDIESFESSDFWDEHSLDIQRYYTTYCHIYGSNPEENEDLVELEILSQEKADQCEDEYYFLQQSWLQVLDPYLKH